MEDEMITKETAERIWVSYREIQAAEKLLLDMKQKREDENLDKMAATLTDAFGRRQHLQLGIPSGENGHRLFYVSPMLAEPVIRAHIAARYADLAEANEQARIELNTAETFTAPERETDTQ